MKLSRNPIFEKNLISKDTQKIQPKIWTFLLNLYIKDTLS